MARAQKETNFLVSTAGTGYVYTNRKNKKKSKGENKISLKKYDPIAREHVLFEEKSKPPKLKSKYVRPEGKSSDKKSEPETKSA